MHHAQDGVSAMGADLYIRSLYDKHTECWQPLLDEAVKERDKLQRGTPEYDVVHNRVAECFEQLGEVGYFRDP